MDKEKRNMENAKKIISLISILENVRINKKEIIEWAKEDVQEICKIQHQLEKIALLEYAYKKKEITDISNLKLYIEEKNILKIYNIINKELNNWRNINMAIQVCYAQVKNCKKGNF